MKGELTAYYVDYGYSPYEYGSLLPLLQLDYPDLVINATAFATQDELLQTIMTELNAGAGPDLILMNYATPLSFDKLSRNGTFLNLSPYMASDSSYDPANYYESVIQAGQVNGNQYILPLAFSQMNFLTTQEKLHSNGAKLTGDYTWEDVLDALTSAVETAALNDETIPTAMLVNRDTFLAMLLSGLGIPIVDIDKGQVILKKEDCQKIADTVKAWRPYARKAFSDKEALVLNTQSYTNVEYFICNNNNYLYYYQIKQVDAIMEEETVFIPFPSFTDSSQTVGQVSMYAAVNSNSTNKQLAYDTIRALMDFPLSGSFEFSAIDYCYPIRKDTFQNILNVGLTGTITVSIDKNERRFHFNEETNKEILNQVNSIQDIVIENQDINKILDECLYDYIFTDTRTFDECWDDLVNRLTLYINE